jgi:hypothetical protein
MFTIRSADLRRLGRPPRLATGQRAMRSATTFAARPRLETLAQAEARNLQRIDVLTDRAPEIAAALEACDPAALCCLVICAVCSRRYRFRLIRRLLAIARSRPGQHEIATIYLGTYPAGTLPVVAAVALSWTSSCLRPITAVLSRIPFWAACGALRARRPLRLNPVPRQKSPAPSHRCGANKRFLAGLGDLAC